MIFSAISLAVLCGGFLDAAHGWHLPKFGRCPQLHVKQNFNLEKYMGVWYQQASAHTEFEGKGRCITAIYTYNNDTEIINVTNTKIEPSNKFFSMEGTAVLQDPDKKEGKLEVTFPLHFLNFKFTGPYWILDTDYELYAVVYGCKEFFWFFHDYSSVLFSRIQDLSAKKKLEEKFVNKTNKVLQARGINLKDFSVSNNLNCNT
ncbi:apolipoprotein D-like [Macrosteles quadrilineatus]|uniref:apolipoprotein D-like n=1 Tax=Macrosteles quadrilineatus TaxID=74068 RepID=UPI0023E0C7D9|nr:apolipoprotein D-like [Macrosteles quadrilineatus]